MTVKELQKAYPYSNIFIKGLGYPTRMYPTDFSKGERIKLARTEVETLKIVKGDGYWCDNNIITITIGGTK